MAQTENAVRSALGLLPLPIAEGADRRHVRVSSKSPRARHWARLFAITESSVSKRVAILDPQQDAADSQALDIDVHAADFAASGKRKLPICPGPFGGTTLIVLPQGLDQSEIDAWLELEANDPLNKRSRFHRLRIAVIDGAEDRALPAMLEKLSQRNRNNVLIMPAMFCADGALMRGLYDSAGGATDTMTLHWRPGLGAK